MNSTSSSIGAQPRRNRRTKRGTAFKGVALVTVHREEHVECKLQVKLTRKKKEADCCFQFKRSFTADQITSLYFSH